MHHVYLIAAEGDAEVASELETFLKRRGCIVRVDTGAHFFSPARPHEKTVALWSFNTRMSSKQIMFTNRAIDALTENALVLAALDMHALPRGLSDVPVVDLKFVAARIHRFQEVYRALDELRAPPPQPVAPAPKAGGGGENGDGGPEDPLLMEKRASDELMVEESDSDSLFADSPVEKVFVSYAVKNADVVYPLSDHIESLGMDVWIDKQRLQGGHNWAGEIVRGIKAAETFCLMCSKEAFDSDNVRREVYLADKYKKALLPVRLDAAVMPEDIEYFLIDRQWIDLSGIDPAAQRQRLQQALQPAT